MCSIVALGGSALARPDRSEGSGIFHGIDSPTMQQPTAFGMVTFLVVAFLVVAAGCSHSRPYGGKGVSPVPGSKLVAISPAAAGKAVLTGEGRGPVHRFK